MKYKVEVERGGNLVKAETIKDKHPTNAIKKVLNNLDDEVKKGDKEIQINVVNKSGSLWIYKTKFKRKTKKWVGKLVKSFKSFFSTREIRLIFNDDRGILHMAQKKADEAAEDFQDGIDEVTESEDEHEENDKEKHKY